MPKRAVAIRHIHFEDLGSLAGVLKAQGYDIRYCDVGVDDLAAQGGADAELLIVLGAPVGVYEAEIYPFLAYECALLRERIAAGRPTLGICLGAQLMAAALDAQVSPTGTKEIGFSPLSLTAAGVAGPLRHLQGVSVLHWHGDAFAIPAQAEHLASTAICRNQAFALGTHLLALQFHAEFLPSAGIERWLLGHATELAHAGIDIRTLRAAAMQAGPTLQSAAEAMFTEWLQQLSS